MISKKVLYIFLLTLVLLDFFGLKVIHFHWANYLYLLLIAFLAFPLSSNEAPFTKTIKWYCVGVLLSCAYSWSMNGQGLLPTIGASYPFLALFFFFVLLKYDLSADEIQTVLVMLGVICSVAYIVQWLIYPTIIFSSVDSFVGETHYRARMVGSILFYFLLFYSLNKYLLTKDLRYVLYGVLGFIPIIIQGFRSLTLLCGVGFFMMIPLVVRSGLKTAFFSLVGVGLFTLAMSTSLVSSKLDEMADRQQNEQTYDNTDYIRWLSLDYYWNQQYTKPMEKVFGGGYPADKSSKYFKQIQTAKDYYGFFWQDLGLVGLSLIIGIPTVLLLIILYVRCIWRCKETDIQYLRLTMLTVLIASVFTLSELFREGNILILSLLLYLEYKHHSELESMELSEDIDETEGYMI